MPERKIGERKMAGSDGETYSVIEFQELVAVRTKDGQSLIPGMHRLELEDGREVISLDGKDTIRGTKITLSAID